MNPPHDLTHWDACYEQLRALDDVLGYALDQAEGVAEGSPAAQGYQWAMDALSVVHQTLLQTLEQLRPLIDPATGQAQVRVGIGHKASQKQDDRKDDVCPMPIGTGVDAAPEGPAPAASC